MDSITGDPVLDDLLAKVKRAREDGRLPTTITREERVSWVLGNLNASTHHKTDRATVEAALDALAATAA